MPNWCDNQIAVILPEQHDTQAQRQVLWDILRALKYHLDTSPEGQMEPLGILHPVPPGLDDNDAYNWKCRNWDTKWDMEVHDYHYTHNHVVIAGNTAWGPPIGVIDHLQSLGFVVELQYHSCENMEWGSSALSVADRFDMYYASIDEEDEEDEVAKEMWEYEQEKGSECSIEDCIRYFMYHDYQEDEWYEPYFTVLDREWMIERFEYDAETLFESYELWKYNHNPPVTKTEFNILREWMLNKIESSHADGQYNEGQYLELMNTLKNSTISDLRELWEEHNKKFELPKYYSGENREPNLIRIYG